MAATRAESEVSQIHSNGMMMPLGKKAQIQAPRAATGIPGIRLPARKIGMQIKEEKTQLSKAAVRNEANVKMPNILKIEASKRG